MTVKTELEAIRKAHGGDLDPRHVVNYARTHTKSALHGRFTWANDEAAELYRTWEARQIIRVHLQVIDSGDGKKTHRMYCNIEEGDTDHYRATIEVLSQAGQRRALVLKQLDRMQSIYEAYPLPELKGVLAAIEAVRRATKKRGK